MGPRTPALLQASCSQPASGEWSRGGAGFSAQPAPGVVTWRGRVFCSARPRIVVTWRGRGFPRAVKGRGGFLEPISPSSFAAKHWFIGGPTQRSFPLAKETLGSVFCVRTHSCRLLIGSRSASGLPIHCVQIHIPLLTQCLPGPRYRTGYFQMCSPVRCACVITPCDRR